VSAHGVNNAGRPVVPHTVPVLQSPLCLRQATPDDAELLLELTLEAIYTSAGSHYSVEQLRGVGGAMHF